MNGSIVPQGGSSLFDSIRRLDDDYLEYWTARDLMPILGYIQWKRVPIVIERAIAACKNSGSKVSDHFVASSKMVGLGSGAGREVLDYRLSRYACYLIAMNGDPRKKQIAAAQTYFAIKTRQAEVQEEAPSTVPPALHPENEPLPISVLVEAAAAFKDVFGAHYQQRMLRINMERHYPAIALPPASVDEMPPMPSPQALLIPTAIAEQLGMTNSQGNPDARAVNKLLEDLGFQVRYGGKWNPTAKAMRHCVRKPIATGTKVDKDQLFWYPSILEELRQHVDAQ